MKKEINHLSVFDYTLLSQKESYHHFYDIFKVTQLMTKKMISN